MKTLLVVGAILGVLFWGASWGVKKLQASVTCEHLGYNGDAVGITLDQYCTVDGVKIPLALALERQGGIDG